MSKGASGKGSSSAETNQTVTNQQVATESGIAIGANSQASINVSTLDPEVAEAAIRGNSDVSKFAIDRNAAVSQFATGAVTQLSALFGENISDLAAKNINLLQSVNQESTDVALSAQTLAGRALDQSFGVSRAVAPQDANYTRSDLADTTSRTVLYIVLGLAAIFAGYFFLKKKA